MNSRFAVPGVDARTPLARAAPALLLAKAEPLFELEEAARAGADMDAVHDMRVASRRLRETMRLLAPLYPRPRYDTWYKKVRRVTRALGPVRDSDVFIDYFSRLADGLGDGGRRAIAFLVGYRAGQRTGELATLDARLDTLDLSQKRAAFAKLAHSAARSTLADRPLAEFAHAAIAERAATVFGAQPAALAEENMAGQHALRIDYKRLRYAVEVFAPCYVDGFDELHATLTAFQDALGDLHDTDVFIALLDQPTLLESAERAGVATADMGEVRALLETRAHDEFLRFSALAAARPSEVLLPALLLPLATRPTPSIDPASVEIVDATLDSPTISPVVVGDEPWTEGWDESALLDSVPLLAPPKPGSDC